MRELRSLLKKITMMRSKIKMEAGKSSGYPLSLMKTTNTHSQFPRLTSYLLSDLECLITATMSILSTIIMEGWPSKNLKCSKIHRLTSIIYLPCTPQNTLEESRAAQFMVKKGLKWCKSLNSTIMRVKRVWVRWRATESNSVQKARKRRLSICSLKTKNL